MTPNEAAAILTFANQTDPLVALNDANADVWWEALKRQEYDKALWCVKDYYANTAPGRDGRTPSLTPAVLRKRVSDKIETVASKHRAVEGPPKHTRPESYRAKNPDRWDQLVKQGHDDHLADLTRRGIPLTPEQEKTR